jgi:hypothetical protein
VTLSSPILEQNLIVADVPGGSDVNHFRVDNAARYLQQCDMTIVVGKIDRLQDNVGFRQQYMSAFRRRRSGSVILVATRSDVRVACALLHLILTEHDRISTTKVDQHSMLTPLLQSYLSSLPRRLRTRSRRFGLTPTIWTASRLRTARSARS